MSLKAKSSRYNVVIDLTGHDQSCYFCRATLTQGPKYRVHGSVSWPVIGY